MLGLISLVKRLMSRYTMGTLSLMGKVYVTTIVGPYQFDFMFLRSLPEKLDTVGRGKKKYESH